MYNITLQKKYNQHYYKVIEKGVTEDLLGKHLIEKEIGIFPSSTTVLSKHKNAQPLIAWAARMATEYIIEAFKDEDLVVLANDKERLGKIFYEAKQYHDKFKNKRAGEGTEAHNIFEMHAKNSLPKKLSPLEKAYLKQYKLFIKQYKVVPVPSCSEIQVFTTKKGGSAGTADSLSFVDNVLTLVDYKTSKAIYPEYWLQVASYVEMYNECKHGLDIPQKIKDTELKNAGILRISETDYEFKTIPYTAVKTAYKIFLNYLESWYLDKKLKKLIKG